MRLHINVDHVATLRNARGTEYPDPVQIALLCESAGADGITVHLREDRRHIRDADVWALRSQIRSFLNLEMAATDEMIAVARELKPDAITLVPERREEQTTEGGLDVLTHRAAIARVAALCAGTGIRLSLFVAPDTRQIQASHELGAQQIELHTGEYCGAVGLERDREIRRLAASARAAADLGLDVAAGHGLTRQNLVDVVGIAEIQELNIGHAVIADAIQIGVVSTVHEYRAAVQLGVAKRH